MGYEKEFVYERASERRSRSRSRDRCRKDKSKSKRKCCKVKSKSRSRTRSRGFKRSYDEYERCDRHGCKYKLKYETEEWNSRDKNGHRRDHNDRHGRYNGNGHH